jgi:UDP-2-acetamido-2,6-beta-L-arabino-hexul-4-ose reductase
MRILVTGSRGFIAKNLICRLDELNEHELYLFDRNSNLSELQLFISKSDLIIHLAGENRPKSEMDYDNNAKFTNILCNLVEVSGRKLRIIFASTVHAELDTPYGVSKKKAEDSLKVLSEKGFCDYLIFRLPGIFGKWCKPNYNSVVATFCYSVANKIPLKINNANNIISICYIDDLIDDFLHEINSSSTGYRDPSNIKQISLGMLAEIIQSFEINRELGIVGNVGSGLMRSLYSTYISYLEPESFSYTVLKYEDNRGYFAEFLKTGDSGQVSFFTINPFEKRGGHYHHTKTEKFLVIEGDVLFRFFNIQNKLEYEILISSSSLRVVDTVPGWAHEVLNVSSKRAIVLLWSNEIFDPNNPDTYKYQIKSENEKA